MMHSIRKFAAIAALGLASLVTPALAQDLSPVGSWQQTTGETRVKVTLCGDGSQLCAQLTWLSEAARTEKNVPHLNTLVVNGARHVQENTWKGKVHFNGQSATGKIQLVGADTITLSGCKLVVCKEVSFRRI